MGITPQLPAPSPLTLLRIRQRCDMFRSSLKLLVCLRWPSCAAGINRALVSSAPTAWLGLCCVFTFICGRARPPSPFFGRPCSSSIRTHHRHTVHMWKCGELKPYVYHFAGGCIIQKKRRRHWHRTQTAVGVWFRSTERTLILPAAPLIP